MLMRFPTAAGEHGAADAERDVRGLVTRFYTEESNRDLVGNNTPVFFVHDPLRSPISSASGNGIRIPTCAA